MKTKKRRKKKKKRIEMVTCDKCDGKCWFRNDDKCGTYWQEDCGKCIGNGRVWAEIKEI